MNPFIVTAVIILLFCVLVLLSQWQRKIAELQKEKVIANIRGAEERGTSQPLAQHPQIDEQACIGCGSCIDVCPEDEVLGLVDGIAHVIHGSRCIGHGLCAAACPVDAVKIGLGDVSGRSDLPILSDGLETAMPGMYIAGELGGFALIRIAVNQGTKVISAIAREVAQEQQRSRSKDEVLDVLIVGVGPAGIAASLKAEECNLNYVAIDQEDIGGTVRKYPRRKLTLVGALTLPLYGRVKQTEFLKEELIEFWEKIIADHNLRIHTGVKFLGAERTKQGFVAETSKGRIRARRILLALGRRGSPRKLGVPGEEAEKVLYQLIDTATYSNEHILVVGGGDSAVEAATGLANQTGNVVTLSYRREDFFRLKSRNEERIRAYAKEEKLRLIFNSNVQRISADSVDLVRSVNGVDKKIRLRNDYVFIFAGGEPPYPLMRKIGVKFNGDDVGETSPEKTAVARLER